jgi:hypothetical protein
LQSILECLTFFRRRGVILPQLSHALPDCRLGFADALPQCFLAKFQQGDSIRRLPRIFHIHSLTSVPHHSTPLVKKGWKYFNARIKDRS